jgi:hypothetical protein
MATTPLKNDDLTLVGTLNHELIGGEIFPHSKIVVGAAGVNDGYVSLANGFPVQAATGVTFAITAAALPLPAGASTEATLSALSAKLAAAGLLADNTANPSTTLIGSCLLGFDGATWDRLWAIADGDVVSAAAKGFLMFGHDGANYQAVNVDSSGRMVVTINGPVTTTISGAVDTELPAAAALADAAGNPTTPTVGSALLIFNGATWDRLRGDTTNGAFVNVKAVPADPFGLNADAIVAAGAAGSISAKLRRATQGLEDLKSLIVLAAGTNLLGKAAVGEDCKIVYDGTTSVTVKYANIDTATSGNNAIVAAVAAKKIKVVSLFLAASGAVDVYFNDGTANLLGGTRKVKLDNTGAVGSGGFVLQENLKGWFETAAVNRPLNLNLSAAIGVAGCLAYVEVYA